MESQTCDACGETYEGYNPGWDLPYDTFGYDGGFDDNLRVLLGKEKSRCWWMCHDCVVKFLETFPRLAESIGPNCHPAMSKEDGCCRHAWAATALFATKIPGPQIFTWWPDGVRRETDFAGKSQEDTMTP